MASQDDPSSLLGIDLGGRYRIKDFIDSGAFSFVYRACDLNNGTDVAVKVLQPRCAGQVAIWEMNGERQLLSTMSSRSNIIDTYDGERHDLTLNIPGSGASLTVPLHYVAMELASGTLSDVVLYRDRFSWDDRLSLFRAVAKGLHQMHISDIVHRDLKSDNVLLFTAPDQPVAKLCDLGRGVAVNEPRRFPREAYAPGRGHRLYAPPEYIWEIGSTDPSSWQKGDLYLLGSVLYELATGYQITSAVTAAVHGMANPYQHLSIDERRDRFFGSIRKLEAYYEGRGGFLIRSCRRQSARRGRDS